MFYTRGDYYFRKFWPIFCPNDVKTNVAIIFLHKLAVFWPKQTPQIINSVLGKLKNCNIGPSSCVLTHPSHRECCEGAIPRQECRSGVHRFGSPEKSSLASFPTHFRNTFPLKATFLTSSWHDAAAKLRRGHLRGQFFKTRIGASWRLCSKLAPARELMQQWRGSAALRRRQLFRRRENLFKKLASGADPTTFGNYNYNAGVVVG
jgi:hypothetical protein